MASVAVSASQSQVCTVPQPFSPEAERELRKICQNFRTEEEISKIIDGVKSGWQGWFEPHPLNPSRVYQSHVIGHVKVYFDKQLKLVADIALTKLSKTQELECKIYANGTFHLKVRHCNVKGANDFDYLYLRLARVNELAVREKLSHIHFLPFDHSGSYVSKLGCPTDRYESPFYENLLGFQYSLTDKKKYIQSLHIFCDALSALQQMHSQDFIHKSFRLGTIFFRDGRGFLGGLDIAAPLNAPYLGIGSDKISPLETCMCQNQKSDMFSVGASLLRLYRPDLRREFDEIQENLWPPPGREIPTEKRNWSQNIRCLQQRLLDPNGPEPHILSQLISDLIDPDPQIRPTCTQAIERWKEIIHTLEANPDQIDLLPFTKTEDTEIDELYEYAELRQIRKKVGCELQKFDSTEIRRFQDRYDKAVSRAIEHIDKSETILRAVELYGMMKEGFLISDEYTIRNALETILKSVDKRQKKSNHLPLQTENLVAKSSEELIRMLPLSEKEKARFIKEWDLTEKKIH